jgi:5S rRNA maturation endonuclease (ribonuclease M5)
MTNLAAHAERIARHYWGEPNAKLSQSGRTLRWGTNGSKELDLAKGAWYDFEADEGGGAVDIVKRYGKLGISGNIADVLERDFGIQKQAQKALEPKQYIQRIYSYYDADGAEAYQACRLYPKSFRLRRPDGKGGYIHSVKDIEPLPYNLPAIMQHADQPVFIVEGEKCADALIEAGLVATTNHGGSGKWLDTHSAHLAGRSVIVLPDNDQAGRTHADKVVASLWGKAERIKRVDLPGLQEKGDVADFLSDHTLDELMEIVRSAPVVTAQPEPSDEPAIEDADGNVIEPFETLDQDAVWSMPPVEFLIDQLLPEKAFTMMYGSPGSGKSFLAIDMALSVANGVPWQGYETKRGAVLYIAGEGVGGFAKRWKAWSKHKGMDKTPDMHVLPVAVNFMDEEEITRLLYTIDRLDKQFSMVVVDTVHRSMHGAEENSASEMARFIDACDTIQRHTGGTMLAVHHSGKNSAQGARGSNSLLGAVSTSLMVGKSDDIVTLRVEKQKDAEPIEGDLRFNMLVVPASISETSVVLERTDEQATRNRSALTFEQEIALAALRSALIDKSARSVHKDVWHAYHNAKAPDETGGKRRDARNALQKKRVIAIESNMCWIINGLEENV